MTLTLDQHHHSRDRDARDDTLAHHGTTAHERQHDDTRHLHVPTVPSDLGATPLDPSALAGLTVDPPADGVPRAVMVQRWTDLVFLHWRVEPGVVQRLLPDGVEVDTFDGAAWVGLIPFSMEGLGFPGLAPLPHVGAFPEVNVRSYVRAGAYRGVWFFSLDVDRRLPAYVARGAYRLPYCFGEASHSRADDLLTTSVERRWPRGPRWPAAPQPARTHIVARAGGTVDESLPLHRFLTARWGLVAAGPLGTASWAPVEHPRWPLHEATVEHLDDTLVSAAGIEVAGEPDSVLWSPGVSVRVGRPRRIRLTQVMPAPTSGEQGSRDEASRDEGSRDPATTDQEGVR